MKTRLKDYKRSLDIEWLLAAVAWITVVVVVNSTPATGLPKTGWLPLPAHFDKAVHFGMYGLMALMLWNAALPRQRRNRPWVAPWKLALFPSALIAGFDELHQLSVPGRSADWIDLAMDWAAILIVIWMGAHKRPV